MILGTGSKIQNMTRISKGQLGQGNRFLLLILADCHSIAVNCLS